MNEKLINVRKRNMHVIPIGHSSDFGIEWENLEVEERIINVRR